MTTVSCLRLRVGPLAHSVRSTVRPPRGKHLLYAAQHCKVSTNHKGTALSSGYITSLAAVWVRMRGVPFRLHVTTPCTSFFYSCAGFSCTVFSAVFPGHGVCIRTSSACTSSSLISVAMCMLLCRCLWQTVREPPAVHEPRSVFRSSYIN